MLLAAMRMQQFHHFNFLHVSIDTLSAETLLLDDSWSSELHGAKRKSVILHVDVPVDLARSFPDADLHFSRLLITCCILASLLHRQ